MEGELWKPGDLIADRFQIGAVKRGSMGLIYYCKYFGDTILPCVIKTLPTGWLVERRDLFMGEVSTWVQLGQHPYIVRAYGAREIEERPCLLLEYVAGDVQHGVDLSGWIGAAELDLRRALTFAWQICCGMRYAADEFHKAGKTLIHRDLKPTNLLVASPDQVKITDFGIALLCDLAQTGAPSDYMDFGDRVYRSPEQGREDPHLDARADIYVFGCVLYEMLTGTTVFDLPRTSYKFFEAHRREIPRNPRQLNPGIPPAVDDLVMKCLKKDAGERYPDFAALQNKLGQIYADLFSAPPAPPPPERCRRNQGQEKAFEMMTNVFLGKPGEVLKTMIETRPARDDSDWLIMYTEALVQSGRSEEALLLLREAVKRPGDYSLLWNQMGRLLGALERHEEALVCYERALERNPRNPGLLNNKAYVLIALNRPEEALTCLEECLTFNRRLAAAWNNKGRAYAALEKWEQASKCYECSVEINPAEAEVWYNWSVAAGNLNQADKEKEYLQKCLTIDPDHWKARHNVGVCHAMEHGDQYANED